MRVKKGDAGDYLVRCTRDRRAVHQLDDRVLRQSVRLELDDTTVEVRSGAETLQPCPLPQAEDVARLYSQRRLKIRAENGLRRCC